MPGMRSFSSIVWLPTVTVAFADVIPILEVKRSARDKGWESCTHSSRARIGPSGFVCRRTRVICSLGIQTFTPTLMLYAVFDGPSRVTRLIEKADSCTKRYDVGLLRETA